MHVKTLFPSIRFVAMQIMLIFTAVSCASTYISKPLELEPPPSMSYQTTIPGTRIVVGVRPYNTPQLIHAQFQRNGMWRESVIPVKVVIQSIDEHVYRLEGRSAYIAFGSQFYPPVSPDEAFDISWQAFRNYIAVKKTLYYTGLVLFTIVTLGLGSVIWVLPTPFKQPKPDDTPFGRDLTYKSLPKDLTLYKGTLKGGFLYFRLPKDRLDFKNADLILHLVQKTPVPEEKVVTIPLHPNGKTHSNPFLNLLNGFFTQ